MHVPNTRWALLALLALAPVWLVGIFDRAFWTPDEPREADIAWRMSHQDDRTLPELAGTPFLEKPPLSYWAAGGSLQLFGDAPAAARIPNIVYAAVTALCIGALAFAMQGTGAAALIAALVAATAITAYRVAIWLAPDACLLAGCAMSLLGAYLGYTASPGRRKLLGYSLMHVGAAIGFMAKSAPGWLTPGVALVALIVWERRWRELQRWELYAGFVLQALIIGPWIFAVTQTPNGADALLALFWHNIVGRFTKIAAPEGLDYTTGHQSSPGKYFIELPIYLLPWTVLAVAALRRAWDRVRLAGHVGTRWRFGVAATLPFLIVLSLAATARDIYAAPALLGFAVLIALWLDEARRSPTPFDHTAIRWTRWLVAFLAGVFVVTLALLAAAYSNRTATPSVHSPATDPGGYVAPWTALVLSAAAVLVVVATIATLRFAGEAERTNDLYRSFTWIYTAHAVALCLTAVAVFPVIDRWQNLPALASRIQVDSNGYDLALLSPDETTIAMLDRGLRTRFTVLPGSGGSPEQIVDNWFDACGARARILVLLPGHAPGELSRLLERVHRIPEPGDGVAGTLAAAGRASIVSRYELPQGRRYALLGPPAREPPLEVRSTGP